jgi:outer membrane murein-binding lipoprotein Lpp
MDREECAWGANTPQLWLVTGRLNVTTSWNRIKRFNIMKSLKFVIAVVVGTALLSSRASAEGEPKKDDMNKTLERLDTAIKNLESVERGLTDYKLKNSSAVRQVQDDVEILKSQVKRLEEDVRGLRLQGAPPETTSRRIDTSAPIAITSRVKLTNDYPTEYFVILNGISYRLFPGESKTLSVNPGSFTYQVLGLQGNTQTRTVAPGQEYPIRIYTLPY